MKSTDITFSVNGDVISARRWGQEGGIPVIALHGWLDNCASFSFLAPLLKGLDLVTLDLAGHGLSFHRRHLGAYNIWQDIAEILCVAEKLGWKKFSLLGHSRGAMIATLMTATFPEKIAKTVLIEALVPVPIEASEAPAQLASSIVNLMVVNNRPRRYYPSFSAAVDSRSNGIVPMSSDNALALAVRGVRQDKNGYFWGNDYKVMAPSEVKFTVEQVYAFLSCISAPIQLIIGTRGMVKSFAGFEACVARVDSLNVIEIPGDHYLHMAENAEAVANVMNDFL
jgi:Predicted hydrolases or acyltransferases (alpha/beta hydrolase superfamily)